MADLQKKTLKTLRSFTYTYYNLPASKGKPTIILLHGFPDDASLWFGFIRSHIQPLGYGALAIDKLGYGETSKPNDTESYNIKDLTAEVCQIMDAEKLQQAIFLGHDWGSALAQRMYNFYPNRTLALIMVNVAYTPPDGKPYDVDVFNAATTSAFGYPTLEYWNFYASEEAASIADQHLESMWTVLHGPPASWREIWCTAGAMKQYLLEDKTQPTEDYATDEMKKVWIERMKRDGFDGPFRWYKAFVHGIQEAAETGTVALQNQVINVPTLYVGGSQDVVCRPELIYSSPDLLPKLTVINLDAGHWALLAKPKEFGDSVMNWLETVFADSRL